MLTFDPLKRVSAVKALEHPYFQDEEPATQTESLNQGVKSAAGGICVWVQDSFYWFSVLFLHPNRGLNTQTSELEGHRHRRGSVIICVPSLKTEPVVLVLSSAGTDGSKMLLELFYRVFDQPEGYPRMLVLVLKEQERLSFLTQL